MQQSLAPWTEGGQRIKEIKDSNKNKKAKSKDWSGKLKILYVLAQVYVVFYIIKEDMEKWAVVRN